MESNTLVIFMYIIFVVIIVVICILINYIIKRKRLFFGAFTQESADNNSDIKTYYSKFDNDLSYLQFKELVKIGFKPDKIIVYRLFAFTINTAFEFNKDSIQSIKCKVLGKYRYRITIKHDNSGVYSPFIVVVYGDFNKILGVLREYNWSHERDGTTYL